MQLTKCYYRKKKEGKRCVRVCVCVLEGGGTSIELEFGKGKVVPGA
jgi:hypothetical protein